MDSIKRFEPRPVNLSVPSASAQSLAKLESALLCAEGITQAELCVRLRCDVKTLRRRLDALGLLLYKVGWVIYARGPTPTERSTRLQLRFNAGMPGAAQPRILR